MWGQLSTTCSKNTEVAQWGTPSCNRPQPARDDGVSDGRSYLLTVTPHPIQGSTTWDPRTARCKYGPQIARLLGRERAATRMPDHFCLCGHFFSCPSYFLRSNRNYLQFPPLWSTYTSLLRIPYLLVRCSCRNWVNQPLHIMFIYGGTFTFIYFLQHTGNMLINNNL